MNTLRCIIADDEPIAREILENYLSDLPNLELVASCSNAFEVMEQLNQKKVDLLFLDINMPKLSGMSLLKSLDQKPAVIITTAYPEYAIEGFELSVTDYLLKPISFERFIKAVSKVQKSTVPQPMEIAPKQESKTSIFVKSDKKIVQINFDEINYIQAYGNYIKVFENNMVLVSQTMIEFFDRLPKDFIRIHKSYIVNVQVIKSLEGNQIILKNGKELPVGKSYRSELIKKFKLH